MGVGILFLMHPKRREGLVDVAFRQFFPKLKCDYHRPDPQNLSLDASPTGILRDRQGRGLVNPDKTGVPSVRIPLGGSSCRRRSGWRYS